MGLTKRYMEQVEAQGWAAGDETVCPDCIAEEALQGFVRDATTEE